MVVTISKSGTGLLQVDSLDVYTTSPDVKNNELERFQCGRFEIGGGTKLTKEIKNCQTGPYHYQLLEKIVVQVANDGTGDDVSFKIASDSNSVTCSRKLSRLFDWAKNDLETWLSSSLGDCSKDRLYKVS
jgi:hypothetical protein